MTLEQLRIFAAVAERQHVTAAAASLGLTQSAASAAIASLESQYDIKLFDRIGRGIVLTEEGAAFLKEARAVLQRAVDAEDVLHDLGTLTRGVLRIWASQTVGTYWLPSRLVDFRTAYPAVTLDCTISNSEEAADAVREGAAHLGFIEVEITDPHLTAHIVAHDKPLLVVGSSHPWANRKEPVRPKELAATAWVLREKGSGTRAIFDSAVALRGIEPSALDIILELPSNEAVAIAVGSSTAASILSTSAVLSGLESGLLTAVPFDLPARCFYLLTHKSRHLSRSAEAFLARAKVVPVRESRSKNVRAKTSAT
jgi:DNA-binding transcriptional LysR family regulator